jgi:hypothetical protein
MNDRLDQLRGLLDRLERMPASADRDWMLAEVRRRAVDVETETPPAPLRALPRDQPEMLQLAERPARTRAAASTRPEKTGRRTRPARPVQPAARIPPGPARAQQHEHVVDLLERGGVMYLNDPPAGASRAWSHGLRG